MAMFCPSIYPASFKASRKASLADEDSLDDLLLRKPITGITLG
jgi:hypothetical protein